MGSLIRGGWLASWASATIRPSSSTPASASSKVGRAREDPSAGVAIGELTAVETPDRDRDGHGHRRKVGDDGEQGEIDGLAQLLDVDRRHEQRLQVVTDPARPGPGG